jgi:predicted acylesterase/phospholipase RssA/CRP-like cAMP-binding protein
MACCAALGYRLWRIGERPEPLLSIGHFMELAAAPSPGVVSAADLSASDLFHDVDEGTLRECAARARIEVFGRGAVLAREGDAPDAFFLLLEGSVEVVHERAGDSDIFINALGRGDCVGDLALLLGQPRTATVRALRTCRTARISGEDFDWLLHASPEFTLRLARTVGARLQRATDRVRFTRPVERIAVLAAGPTVRLDHFCTSFCKGLLGQQAVGAPELRLLPVPSPSDDFADPTMEVLQEADAVLFIGDASEKPAEARLKRLLDVSAGLRPQPRVHLALLHERSPPYRRTLPWLRDRRISGWHHLSLGEAGDFERLARHVTGRAVGVVLSGGGARGFAHAGVLRALAAAAIPVDAIAGSSMGAIVAALYAAGHGCDAIVDLLRQNYVDGGGIPDFAIPYVALHTGTGTSRRLKRMFGDTRIEDLPTPFLSIASNLSTAESMVKSTGRLWHAVRTSCSVPGLLPPVRSRGGLLVDGGLLDNLPVAAMRERFGGRVIASDVSVSVDFRKPRVPTRRRGAFSRFQPPARMPGLAQILMRTAQLASVRDARISGTPADLYLQIPVDDIGMSDFHRLDEIVERGADYARAQLAGWT